MLDSVGLEAYAERTASMRIRGTIHVCFVTTCLQRPRKEGGLRRSKNLDSLLCLSALPFGVDVDERSEEGMLLGPAFRELVFLSLPLVFLRCGVLLSFAEVTCSTEAMRGVENSDGAIVADRRGYNGRRRRDLDCVIGTDGRGRSGLEPVE